MRVDRYFIPTVLIIAQNAVARQYRTSFLGITWMLIAPIMQIAIFANIMPLIRHAPSEGDYVLYLVSTFPLWGFLISGILTSTASLTSQAETIKRSMVSTAVFPIATVLHQFYSFVVSFSVMLVAWLTVTGQWSPLILLVPIYLLPVLVSVAALGVTVAFLTPYVHDIPNVVHLVSGVLFWLTPVIYPLSAIPAHLQFWFYLNPAYLLMRPVELLVWAGQVPSLADLARLLLVMVVSLAIAAAVYRRCGRNFVYYL